MGPFDFARSNILSGPISTIGPPSEFLCFIHHVANQPTESNPVPFSLLVTRPGGNPPEWTRLLAAQAFEQREPPVSSRNGSRHNRLAIASILNVNQDELFDHNSAR